ncbi:hypothetical protein M885DRAFT_614291 [Pelagophyceae sp. CCMP2097]|nr:hypothetical protein M885DRAFT_614291 [Pelagophyceae sp. CCMP2097]
MASPHRAGDGESHESALLLVHLDRALKTEKAQAADLIERMRLDVQRQRALADAATHRLGAAEARASRAAEGELDADAARRGAEQRLAATDAALRAAETRARAAEAQVETMRSDARRDAEPKAALARVAAVFAATVDAMDDAALAEWSRLTSSLEAIVSAAQQKRAPPPEPVAAKRSYGKAPAAPNDEMDKLLQKYDAAKARLLALEELYPA